jgi:hypothetical protein
VANGFTHVFEERRKEKKPKFFFLKKKEKKEKGASCHISGPLLAKLFGVLLVLC